SLLRSGPPRPLLSFPTRRSSDLSLGRELAESFCEDLRLVILEACEGAKAGAFGSAAEILAKAGADAVVAHLWPVKADTARTCSRSEEHTSELQSLTHLVCRLLPE